jgi:hypothetical protein
MIPKIIHYCWFGGNALPEHAQKCIDSWKKYFPGYEIKEWNETNYDVHRIAYTDQAYHAKKYAFVSDYARFDILYNHGGIYFDTDVEIIKSFDGIIEKGGFMGFESADGAAAGLGIGCNAGLGIVYQIMQLYSTLHFVNSDGTYNLHTVVDYVTAILKQHGLISNNKLQQVDGFTIYPTEYFAPKSAITGELIITRNTHSIHHYDASWITEREKPYYIMKRRLCRFFGQKTGTFFSFPFFVLINIRSYGFKIGSKYILNKVAMYFFHK